MPRTGFQTVWYSTLYLLLALWFIAPARAAPLALDDSHPDRSFALAGHLEAYYDPSGALTQEQISSAPHAAQFSPLSGTFNGGFTPQGAWWLRFAVTRNAEDSGDWWLQLNVPYVDYLDIWLPVRGESGDIGLQHRAIGDMRPVSARDLPWSVSVLRLSPPQATEPAWVWIRVAGVRTLSLTGFIWKLDALTANLQLITFEVAAVIGMMALMAIVCLLLGVALPDRKLLWYAVYLASNVLLFSSSEHFVSVLLLPEHPLLALRTHNIAMCLSLLTAVIFAYSLLDLPEQFPRTAKVFRILAALAVLALGISVAGHYGLIAAPLNLIRLLLAIVIIVLCAILVRRGAPSAWPTFIGYAVYGVVGIALFAKNLDWLPYSQFTQYGYLIGVIVHMLAIFLSLGLRVRNRERQALADSLLAGARLEARVVERTQELHVEIEQRQRAQAQLQRAMHEQRNFLSMVSHEFRTPLSIIGASAELIGDDRLSGNLQDAQREAAKIGRAKQRMLGLVDTLLADEWLESSTMQLSCAEVDLARLLEDSCAEHSDGSGRDIRLEVGKDVPRIQADERLLHIVFDNLIENAIKYSPPATAIELRVWSEADHVLVAVRDHGTGFKADDLKQVFERFYRASAVMQKPGIGLGLYMVRRIAALHGGKVQADNADGGGAKLTVSLPIDGPGRQITQEKSETAPSAQGPATKIS